MGLAERLGYKQPPSNEVSFRSTGQGVIDLGNCPTYEEGVQVDSADYARNARAECRANVQASDYTLACTQTTSGGVPMCWTIMSLNRISLFSISIRQTLAR